MSKVRLKDVFHFLVPGGLRFVLVAALFTTMSAASAQPNKSPKESLSELVHELSAKLKDFESQPETPYKRLTLARSDLSELLRYLFSAPNESTKLEKFGWNRFNALDPSELKPMVDDLNRELNALVSSEGPEAALKRWDLDFELGFLEEEIDEAYKTQSAHPLDRHLNGTHYHVLANLRNDLLQMGWEKVDHPEYTEKLSQRLKSYQERFNAIVAQIGRDSDAVLTFEREESQSFTHLRSRPSTLLALWNEQINLKLNARCAIQFRGIAPSQKAN